MVHKAYILDTGYCKLAMREFEEIEVIDEELFTDSKKLEQLLTFDEISWILDKDGKACDSSILTFEELEASTDINFGKEIFPKIKKIVKDTFYATYHKIDPFKRLNCFEIFSYDFILSHSEDGGIEVYLQRVKEDPISSCYKELPVDKLNKTREYQITQETNLKMKGIIKVLLEETVKNSSLDTMTYLNNGKYLESKDIIEISRFEKIYDERVAERELGSL